MITELDFQNALRAELNIPNKYEFLPILGVDKISIANPSQSLVDNLIEFAWPSYREAQKYAIKDQIIDPVVIEKSAEKLAQFSRDYSFIISFQDGDIPPDAEIPKPTPPPEMPVDCYWN
jgi:hypothetical protein